nr:hypothetical protein CFP56_22203 [Quercus suber]
MNASAKLGSPSRFCSRKTAYLRALSFSETRPATSVATSGVSSIDDPGRKWKAAKARNRKEGRVVVGGADPGSGRASESPGLDFEIALLAQHLRDLADDDEQQDGEEEADVAEHPRTEEGSGGLRARASHRASERLSCTTSGGRGSESVDYGLERECVGLGPPGEVDICWTSMGLDGGDGRLGKHSSAA